MSSGQRVLVDPDVYLWASLFCWSAAGGNGKPGRYAARRSGGRIVYLHRLVMVAPPRVQVDHVNGDTFDCRRDTLRLVTHQQNIQNRRGPNRNSSTGVRNVSYDKSKRLYVVSLMVDRRHVFCGRYKTVEQAARVAEESRRRLMPYLAELNDRA